MRKTTSSDKTTPDAAANPFEGLGAGMAFFSDWMQAASRGMPQFLQATNPLTQDQAPSWIMPTLDTEELGKRIKDLQAVRFWLEQNTQMVSASIQALEVQRMTLDALKGMKVPVDAMQEMLTPTSGAADQPTLVNPMAWWQTMSDQFTSMAQQTMAQTVAEAQKPMSSMFEPANPARKRASGRVAGKRGGQTRKKT